MLCYILDCSLYNTYNSKVVVFHAINYDDNANKICSNNNILWFGGGHVTTRKNITVVRRSQSSSSRLPKIISSEVYNNIGRCIYQHIYGPLMGTVRATHGGRHTHTRIIYIIKYIYSRRSSV